MRLVEISREQFPVWRRLRKALYHGLAASFHEREMELILASAEATCFIGYDATDEAVAMLELSLRNFVDGCLGGPVGYVEGIYLAPQTRGRGEGRRLLDFAAGWFRSRGCQDMAADAELDNEEAQRFLKRAGFEETFRIVEYRRSLDHD